MKQSLLESVNMSVTKPVRKAVFPVAGMGTRFLPATKAVPKEMLPVVDKPVIQYAVEEAREAGIEQFVFVTGRGKHVIEDHFDHAYELETLLSECVLFVVFVCFLVCFSFFGLVCFFCL